MGTPSPAGRSSFAPASSRLIPTPVPLEPWAAPSSPPPSPRQATTPASATTNMTPLPIIVHRLAVDQELREAVLGDNGARVSVALDERVALPTSTTRNGPCAISNSAVNERTRDHVATPSHSDSTADETGAAYVLVMVRLSEPALTERRGKYGDRARQDDRHHGEFSSKGLGGSNRSPSPDLMAREKGHRARRRLGRFK